MTIGDFGPEIFVPFLVFAIPIIAIVGGIAAGIVRMLGQQRLAEMAQQERILAIQRGADPTKLPPLSFERPGMWGDGDPWSPYVSDRRRAQGLMVGGLITLFVGVGIMAFLLVMRDESEHHVWAVGLIPAMVGAALLLSARLVWPRRDNGAPRP